MDKEVIEFDCKFNDFAEISEYYYDEFGKLNAMRASGGSFTKKEAKKMRKRIIFFMDSSFDNLKLKKKSSDKVEKTEIEEFNKEYKAEHKKINIFISTMKSIVNIPKKMINIMTKGKKCAQVELISPEEAQALPPVQDTPGASETTNRDGTDDKAEDIVSSAPEGEKE